MTNRLPHPPPPPPPPRRRPLVNAAGAAEYLGFFKDEKQEDGTVVQVPNVRPIRRWVAERKIPYKKIEKFVMFDLDEIDRWVESKSIRPED